MLVQWSVCDLVFRDEKVLLTFSLLTDQGFKPHFQLDTDASVMDWVLIEECKLLERMTVY